MKVEIKCKGSTNLDISELSVLQGELKELSTENYEKLKKEIIELGFSEPASVWKNEGKWWLLNGTQRYRTLTKMRQDGWDIPAIPVSEVQADSMNQAKRKILSLTSQFGEITKQSLYEFMSTAGIGIAELETSFRFAEIDIPEFKAEFFEDGQYAGTGAEEVTDLGKFDVQCPRCSFRWSTEKTASLSQ